MRVGPWVPQKEFPELSQSILSVSPNKIIVYQARRVIPYIILSNYVYICVYIYYVYIYIYNEELTNAFVSGHTYSVNAIQWSMPYISHLTRLWSFVMHIDRVLAAYKKIRR